MDNNDNIELGRTEELLKQFAPPPVNIDRERLMFLAGQAAAESRQSRLSLRDRLAFRGAKGDKLWPLATLAMTGVAAMLAIALGIQLAQPPQERIVVREVQVAGPSQPVVAQAQPPRNVHPADARPSGIGRTLTAGIMPLALPTSSVFQMRNTALRFGVEALPETPNANPARSAAPSAWGPFHELHEVDAATNSPQ
jgi:hypothetical protein